MILPDPHSSGFSQFRNMPKFRKAVKPDFCQQRYMSTQIPEFSAVKTKEKVLRQDQNMGEGGTGI